MDASPGEVTRLLNAVRMGDQAAQDELARLVYDELHRRAAALMRRERPDHTLQPSDLLQDAFCRLLARDELKDAVNRDHLMALLTVSMRRILVEHARSRNAAKRAGAYQRVPLDALLEHFERQNVDLLDLDEALQELERLHPRQSRVVTLRLFGFTLQEVAEQLGVSVATVQNDFQIARAWLYRTLQED